MFLHVSACTTTSCCHSLLWSTTWQTYSQLLVFFSLPTSRLLRLLSPLRTTFPLCLKNDFIGVGRASFPLSFLFCCFLPVVHFFCAVCPCLCCLVWPSLSVASSCIFVISWLEVHRSVFVLALQCT